MNEYSVIFMPGFLMNTEKATIFTFYIKQLYKDSAISMIGFLACALPLVFIEMHWFFIVFFGSAAALFFVHLMTLVRDFKARLYIDGHCLVSEHFFKKTINLQDLKRFQLKYYDARALARIRRSDDHFEKGWFELILVDEASKLVISSYLEDFDVFLEKLIHYADLTDVSFDVGTKYYLMHFGIYIDKILDHDNSSIENADTKKAKAGTS